jgi:predicted MFS family arabinose efflux permease
MPMRSGFFGWKVAWAAFVIAACGAGAGLYGPSVFLPVLHATRGWPVSLISAAITTHFLVSGCIVIYLPELHRRYPLGAVTRMGALSCGLGIITWSVADAPWQLLLAALLTGIGWATTSSAAINAMVARWFERERAKALSLALNGASVGGILFPPIWVALVAHLGFTPSGLVVAGIIVSIVWPLAYRFLELVPADLGLRLDGLSDQSPPQQASGPAMSRRGLLRDRRFATMSIAFALGLFAQIGLVAHLISRLTPELGAGGAAGALSLITLCAILGRTLLGWYLGSHNRRLAAVLNFFVQSAGVLLLAVGSGTLQLLAGCILFGLPGGNHLTLPPLIAQQEFAHADVATVVALSVAISQGAMAFGPAVFGLLFDATGGYVLPFILAALADATAAVILLGGRKAPR